MRTSEYYHFNRVYKYGGVYVLWNKNDEPLYVGYASEFKERFRRHYVFLEPLIHSFSIYPTNQNRLLEYTLIQRLNPIHNKHRDWNNITRGEYGDNAYLLDEKSYWGHKIFKKGEYPYEFDSLEDKQYFEQLFKLETELKRLSLKGK